MIPYKYASGGFLSLLGFLMTGLLSHAQGPQKPMVYEDTVGGLRFLEEGQPPAMIHATVDDMKRFREANPQAQRGLTHAAGTSSNLYYHGGAVETSPKVYLVLWGSQWSKDPSGEASILQNFYDGVGGSSWLNSVSQYCQGLTTVPSSAMVQALPLATRPAF